MHYDLADFWRELHTLTVEGLAEIAAEDLDEYHRAAVLAEQDRRNVANQIVAVAKTAAQHDEHFRKARGES